MAAAHVTSFKNKYQPAAIAAAAGTKIFPETILSAAALESNWGRSALTLQANNFFGIKAGSSWKGPVQMMQTREQKPNGTWYTVNAPFRKYATAQDCFKDYVKVITQQRYVNAGVTTATTPEQQFAALKKGGYATDVNYPGKLASVLKTLGGYFASIVQNNPATATGAVVLAVFFFS